jgi:DNA-binding transcriptional MocR family regulator
MSSPDQPADDQLVVVAGSANESTYVPLALAMQYSGSTGNPKLSAFIREHVERSFHIPCASASPV